MNTALLIISSNKIIFQYSHSKVCFLKITTVKDEQKRVWEWWWPSLRYYTSNYMEGLSQPVGQESNLGPAWIWRCANHLTETFSNVLLINLYCAISYSFCTVPPVVYCSSIRPSNKTSESQASQQSHSEGILTSYSNIIQVKSVNSRFDQ